MSRARPVSTRTRVVAMVVVVAMVALSAATLLGILLSGGGESQPDAPAPSTPAPGAAPELTLVLPGATTGRCAAVSADVLRGAEQAFAGTAVTVDDGEVVLLVDRWYRGGDAGLVRLTTGDSTARVLVEELAFTEGQRYLVSADSGVVAPCGYSAPWSPAMARTYAEAFEG